MDEKVLKFLEKNNMNIDKINLQKEVQIFIDEMKKGLEGKEKTLSMIPTYIGKKNEVKQNEKIIVIDAGGTNFRVALVYFNDKFEPVIEYFENYPMPGSKGEIGKEEFFETCYEYIKPIYDKSDKISFCFSYPTEILPNKDGKLISFSKEVNVKDMIGVTIGETLIRKFKEKGYKEEKEIVLLNDTVATLLAGKSKNPDRIFDDYIGFILGTGTNTCYYEESKRIKKINDEKIDISDSMIINIESGNYNRIPKSELDISFSETTNDPGEYMLEKAVSGAYQGRFLLHILKQTEKEGIFSGEFIKNIKNLDKLSSKNIDQFLYYPYSDNTLAKCCASEEDRRALFDIIDCIFERAAIFVVINLTAVLKKAKKGKNPLKPVCITADGTTFYKSKLLKDKVNYYVKSYMEEIEGLYCEFVKVENATLLGTAIAGLIG